MPQVLDGKCHGIIVKNKNLKIVPPSEWIAFFPQDNALLATLIFYRSECSKIGAEDAQLASIDKLIDRVVQWRHAHPERCKVADVQPGELIL